jgi:MFS family permease
MAFIDLRPNRLSVGGKPVHYAWVIVAVAALMRLSTSAFRSSQAVLIPRIVETFEWSYGAVGGAFALQWVVSGMFGPAAGWMGDRFGIRITMLIGAALFTVGMVLTGMVSNLWQFYLFFGIILSMSMGIFQVPLTAAVTLWFRRHLGVGMGTLQASQGVGPLVIVPLILLIVAVFGSGETGRHLVSWLPGIGGAENGLRAAFWLPGIGGGLMLIAMIRLFYNEPGEIGMRPLGASNDEPVRRMQKGEVAKVRTQVFLRRAQRTSAFWNLIGIHYWGCAGHAIILVFLVAMAEDRGVSQAAAAGTFVALSVTSTLTRFGVPIAADLLGSKWVMAVCFFLQVVPVAILFFAHDAWMFYLFAILFGIGFGGEMTAFPIINRQYYAHAPMGTTYGWQMMGAGLGMASGAALGGLLVDLTGGFTATMALSLILSAMGVISILFLPTTSRQQISDWEEGLPEEVRAAAAS